MQFTVERNWIDVVGGIWMPYGSKCALKINLSDYDIRNIGEPTRDNIEQWLACNAGDFSSIDDFHAIVGETEIPWATEEGELTFSDCMHPAEDWEL